MRVIRVATLLTVVFWLIILIQQALFIPHALEPRFIYSPLIGPFARRYVVMSSIEIVFLIAIAGALIFCVYRLRRVWPAIALCMLFTFAIWRWFIQPLPIFFRPPLGDGSLHGALAGYLHFHASDLWLDLTKMFLVLGCFALWIAASYHFAHARERKV
jgi:hypothetical protein